MTRSLTALALAAFAASTVTLAGCGPKSGAAADSSSAASAPASAPAAAPPSTGATPASGATTADPRVTAADQNRILGDSTAKLWMLVVSDFQCPFCGQWERETAADFIKEFVNTGKVRLAFLNYPLQQHPNAVPAAEAAMCAGAQGKFWQVHDRIFARQAEWSALPDSPPFFEKLALDVVGDADAYKACIRDHVMRPMIFADAERASAAGARSTPTFFIGNQVIAGAEKIDAFRKAVSDAMAALPK